jgi:hypothetical protein
MNIAGGENFLQTCLAKIDPSRDVDKNFFRYKYANRKHAADYHGEEYVSKLTEEDKEMIRSGASYVITCFCHLEFFVAWHQSSGFGSGKYKVSKSDLSAFENDTECDYQKHLIGKTEDAMVYIFRNESGFNKFFNDAVKPSLNNKHKSPPTA